ncbi:MAG: SigE family RNA polymerase sigma factor [Nocardioidaceae bacterium]
MDATAAPDRLEFADYVAAQRPSLLRAAYAITGDRDSAEDLLQSALAGVFTHWAGIRDHRAADRYVRRAMVNQQASWFRQRWRTAERVMAELPEPNERWDDPRVQSPSERQELWPMVRMLPPRQRSAVVLRYYEGLSEAETAAVLRCSVGTVKSSTSRGLASLRRLALQAGSVPLAG